LRDGAEQLAGRFGRREQQMLAVFRARADVAAASVLMDEAPRSAWSAHRSPNLPHVAELNRDGNHIFLVDQNAPHMALQVAHHFS